MTQEQLDAGRAWLERRSNGDPNSDTEFSWYGRMADQEPALLAFLGAYQARLEAHAAELTTATDEEKMAELERLDIADKETEAAENAAWLALIEGAGEGWTLDETGESEVTNV